MQYIVDYGKFVKLTSNTFLTCKIYKHDGLIKLTYQIPFTSNQQTIYLTKKDLEKILSELS